jgi:hypothetical protein
MILEKEKRAEATPAVSGYSADAMNTRIISVGVCSSTCW